MMGGTSNGMGGASTQQTGAPNTNLQQLFASNGPVQSAQLPQITAPVRPAMPQMPGPAMPQQPPQGAGTPFGDMSFAQRIGMMMGGRMDPSGKMNLPSGLDRGSAIAARNLSKSAVLNGQQNPFGRNPFSPQGGSR